MASSNRSASLTIGGSNPLQFVVHPLPGSSEQLTDRLREVGDRLRLPSNARAGPLVRFFSFVVSCFSRKMSKAGKIVLFFKFLYFQFGNLNGLKIEILQ